jgi:apolipoprotein N-acyltransferase
MLSRFLQLLFTLISYIIVAFGQPVWSWWGGLIAAMFGYAIFFRVLLCYSKAWHRFFVAGLWFAAIQWTQLFWLTSHPYYYAYLMQMFFSVAIGIQFGFLGMLITPNVLQNTRYLFVIPAFWTFCEWSRLFFLSGYSWNPAGLALTGSVVSLQMASIWGIFGLSFWVIFVNLLAVRAWMQRFNRSAIALFVIAAAVPFLFGFAQLQFHRDAMKNKEIPVFKTLLVQTVFLAEESMDFSNKKQYIDHILNEWEQIIKSVKPHEGKQIDLIVLPEYIVPGGAYTFMFPYEIVRDIFISHFGMDVMAKFPSFEEPYVSQVITSKAPIYLVNNAFIVQTLSNFYNAGLVVGLEDVEDVAGVREHYSAAMYFQPLHLENQWVAERYEKRVLLPLGEYIPFEWCKTLAAKYGISGSFVPGKSAKVFLANGKPFGLSICYEETFGDLMRENQHLGAKLLVNMTSDVWYPNSKLPMQHFSHGLLRTVENGIPLVRSSNLGITGAVDSFGQVIALVEKDGQPSEWVTEALKVDVPMYTHQTLYSYFGDALILGICLAILLFAAFTLKK